MLILVNSGLSLDESSEKTALMATSASSAAAAGGSSSSSNGSATNNGQTSFRSGSIAVSTNGIAHRMEGYDGRT